MSEPFHPRRWRGADPPLLARVMRGASIRRRLLVLLLVAMGLTWGLGAFWSFRDARHELDELFDAELVQSARLLAQWQGLGGETRELHSPPLPDDALPERPPDEPEALLALGGADPVSDSAEGLLYHPYQRKVAFQLWSMDGRLLQRSSEEVPTTPFSRRARGFDVQRLDGRPWRIFVLELPERGVRIQTAQMLEVRRELAGAITGNLFLPLLGLLPVLALLIWGGVSVGLLPLARLGVELGRRSPSHLEPLATEPMPMELQPVVQALNGLLARLEQALRLERQFTADAAHELRTPLAALKTQAQVALRASTVEGQRLGLEQVLVGVDRMTHLVEQLLFLARLDPAGQPARVRVGLRPLVISVLAELGPMAVHKGVELGLEEGVSPSVWGELALLRVVVRNLVDNAIRYTPSGGAVSVQLLVSAEEVLLEVEDTGPGIPLEERERVLDRFYRVLGSGVEGSGLGLAIVSRIVGLLGAKLELLEGRSGRGLRVLVHFPITPES